MIIPILQAILHFALRARDPLWTCELAHRDPGAPGTYLLYCEEVVTTDDEVLVEVGHFIPDAGVVSKETP